MEVNLVENFIVKLEVYLGVHLEVNDKLKRIQAVTFLSNFDCHCTQLFQLIGEMWSSYNGNWFLGHNFGYS